MVVFDQTEKKILLLIKTQMEGQLTWELRVLGLPEGPSLSIVAGPFIIVTIVLRPSLPLSVLHEAQHHVRQAQIAVHGLLMLELISKWAWATSNQVQLPVLIGGNPLNQEVVDPASSAYIMNT
jgi:hypothetical protein